MKNNEINQCIELEIGWILINLSYFEKACQVLFEEETYDMGKEANPSEIVPNSFS